MRVLPTCALLLSLSAIPGFGQSSTTSTTLPASASDTTVDYSALRANLASQNKSLQDQVNNQRALVKKNEVLLKDAQRLDASNRKLLEEKKKLDTENASLEKQRHMLKTPQGPIQSASVSDSN